MLMRPGAVRSVADTITPDAEPTRLAVCVIPAVTAVEQLRRAIMPADAEPVQLVMYVTAITVVVNVPAQHIQPEPRPVVHLAHK